jgi:hypothetical protein
MIRRLAALTPALVGIGMTAVFVPGALAVAAPTSTGICGVAKTRPRLISLAVDGDAFLAGYHTPGHLPYGRSVHLPSVSWTEWSATKARATGWEWVDNDHPSVGGGTYTAFPATVVLYRPRAGAFTRMAITAQIPQTFIRRWHGGWSGHETLSSAVCRNKSGIGWN